MLTFFLRHYFLLASLLATLLLLLARVRMARKMARRRTRTLSVPICSTINLILNKLKDHLLSIAGTPFQSATRSHHLLADSSYRNSYFSFTRSLFHIDNRRAKEQSPPASATQKEQRNAAMSLTRNNNTSAFAAPAPRTRKNTNANRLAPPPNGMIDAPMQTNTNRARQEENPLPLMPLVPERTMRSDTILPTQLNMRKSVESMTHNSIRVALYSV